MAGGWAGAGAGAGVKVVRNWPLICHPLQGREPPTKGSHAKGRQVPCGQLRHLHRRVQPETTGFDNTTGSSIHVAGFFGPLIEPDMLQGCNSNRLA